MLIGRVCDPLMSGVLQSFDVARNMGTPRVDFVAAAAGCRCPAPGAGPTFEAVVLGHIW